MELHLFVMLLLYLVCIISGDTVLVNQGAGSLSKLKVA